MIVGDIVNIPKEIGMQLYNFKSLAYIKTDGTLWLDRDYRVKLIRLTNDGWWIVDIQTGDEFDGRYGVITDALIDDKKGKRL